MERLVVRRLSPEEIEAKRREKANREAARRLKDQEGRELQVRLEERYRHDRRERLAARTPHGPTCGCPWCLGRREDAEDKAQEIVPLPDPFHGLVYDGMKPMPQAVQAALTLPPIVRGGHCQEDGFVIEWNLPHHGKGQPDCSTALERVCGLMPNGNADWWTRLKTCAQRECKKCGVTLKWDLGPTLDSQAAYVIKITQV
jgi:hypothetical protein